MKRVILFILILSLITTLFPSFTLAAEASGNETIISASGEELQALFYGRSGGKHPRLYADEDRFTELKQTIHTDSFLEKWYSDIYEYYGDVHLSEVMIWVTDPAMQVSSGKRFNDLFDGIGRIANTAFLYQISGESRFAECALKDMMMLAGQSCWDYNFLEMAQITYAMGLGYDWLYDYMTAAQRKTICDAIYHLAIDAYFTLSSDQIYWKTASTNLNSWAYGGLTIGALAIFDSYPDRCAAFLSEMVTNIQNSMRIYAPCGSYPEGPDYSVSGLSFTVYTLEACLSVLGTEFGLSKINGFRESGEYLPAINGYTASFNYGDGGVYMHNSAALFWYANHFQKPELALWQRSRQTHDIYTHDSFFALLWYEPELLKDYVASQAQKDYLLRDDVNYQSVATFRSDADSPQQIYAAIKSGYIRSSHHTDTDIGTFIMDAMGVRWFCELGSEDYSILNNSASGYWDWTEGANRWKHYRKRAEGQNTLVINPSTAAGQYTNAKCQISDYQSLKDGGYAVVDMTNAYGMYGASSVKRGLMLFDGRSRVLLRDEIVCSSPSTIYWFAHTQANISISADGKTATLTRGGKTLIAQIASPSSATFTSMAAEPLIPLNPNPDGQKSNAGYRKLVIKLTDVNSTELAVVFTPLATANAASKELPTTQIARFSSLLQSASSESILPVNAKGEYEISTPEQLVKFSSMVNSGNSFSGKTVRLMNDLDLQGWTFQPIGGGVSSDSSTGKAFSGTFDGGNHVIRNVFLYRPKDYYVALFGNINGATIKNLGIESGRVFGYDKASGLIGLSTNSTVSNCYSRANVIGTGPYHAGLIAQIVLATTVQNCYYNGSVCGTATTGGLIGYVGSNSTLTMSNCYHVGLLTGSAEYTGMIGYYHTSGTMSAKKISVSKCYSTQRLKGTKVAENPTVESYEASGTITAAQMVSAAIYIGGEFIYDCEWENEGYPVLRWQCNTSLPQDGILTTAAQLRLIAWQVNSGMTDFSGKNFYLANNLDFECREWIPIGGNTTSPSNQGKAFAGSFDGQGHSIQNLQISSGNCFVALFGRLTGRVSNLGIRSGQVQGYHIVAGISAYGGMLDRCYNNANIHGHTGVGGVIAMANNEATTNCYNTGDVTASYLYGGGIVGYYSSGAAGAYLENCYNTGIVRAEMDAGGIVGAVNHSVTGLAIENCYSTSGNTLVGGNGTQFLMGSSQLSASQLQGAATDLGYAYCADEMLQNDGYPVLTWQTRSTSASEALLFDFRCDTTALARYADHAYGGYNFDLTEHWVTAYSGTGNGDTEVKMDPEAGVMLVNLTMREGTNGEHNTTSLEPVGKNKDFAWGTQVDRANELHYNPQHAQILQIRFKLNGVQRLGEHQPRINLYYLPDGAERWSNAMDGQGKESFAFYITDAHLKGGSAEGQYETMTISLTGSKFVTYEEIRGLHIQFSQLRGGTATIDYIYIGPEQSDTLMFGFEQDIAAKERYKDLSYGGYDFDVANHWGQIYTSPVSVENGHLLVPLTTDATKGQSIIQPTNLSKNFAWSHDPTKANVLHYIPHNAERLQIRLRFNGAVQCAGKQPGLWLYYLSGNAMQWSMSAGEEQEGIYLSIAPEYISGGSSEGQYITLTAPLDEKKIRQAESIKGIMLNFINLYQGTAMVDYIYIGPKSGLPTPQYTVTFKDGTGKTLATQMVYKGGTATYTGSTPTKAYDASCHYTFVGWDRALVNITADTTITALFSATVHAPIYTPKDAGVHTTTCENCDHSEEVAHSYTDGKCICGQEEVKEPVLNNSLTIGHTLNLASDISVNFVVFKALLQDFDMDTVYMLTEMETYEGNTKTGTTTVKLLPVEQGDYYYFTLTGLTAIRMNDRLSSVLYGTKDGQPYYSATDEYSIATYAYSQMDKATMSESLKILCADLLRYGASAQTFKGYRTDALADAAMTEVHKTYLSDMDNITFGNHNRILNDLPQASITWTGKSLNLESKVALKFVFSIPGYSGNLEDLSLRVSYTNIEGKTVTATVKELEAYSAANSQYAFSYSGLLAAELRSVVSVQIYEKDIPVSCTLQYSADTYGNNKTGALLEVCKALFAYSDSAYSFFR